MRLYDESRPEEDEECTHRPSEGSRQLMPGLWLSGDGKQMFLAHDEFLGKGGEAFAAATFASLRTQAGMSPEDAYQAVCRLLATAAQFVFMSDCPFTPDPEDCRICCHPCPEGVTR